MKFIGLNPALSSKVGEFLTWYTQILVMKEKLCRDDQQHQVNTSMYDCSRKLVDPIKRHATGLNQILKWDNDSS
jgi:hypothetical protein